MQGEPASLASEPSGQGEEASPEGLVSCHRLAQADACGPACQVMGGGLYGQPGGVGGEAARGEMVETHPVLEVADGVIDDNKECLPVASPENVTETLAPWIRSH